MAEYLCHVIPCERGFSFKNLFMDGSRKRYVYLEQSMQSCLEYAELIKLFIAVFYLFWYHHRSLEFNLQ